MGRTESELVDRLRRHLGLERASTFDDEESAERMIASVLRRRAVDVEQWAKDPRGRLALVEDLGEQTGTSVTRDGATHRPTGVRVILYPDNRTPLGWRILTAFPD